ncbi:hypothetical protein IQ07DRAFT_43557 [Pyrenochaeta sp. DS3sAY3a]|nr:hypothetical protein IQ07DRAFT_43557 [Pyrenochaeta sp. DS3sAY3a]
MWPRQRQYPPKSEMEYRKSALIIDFPLTSSRDFFALLGGILLNEHLHGAWGGVSSARHFTVHRFARFFLWKWSNISAYGVYDLKYFVIRHDKHLTACPSYHENLSIRQRLCSTLKILSIFGQAVPFTRFKHGIGASVYESISFLLFVLLSV